MHPLHRARRQWPSLSTTGAQQMPWTSSMSTVVSLFTDKCAGCPG
jgi:hypothetical protein